MQYVLWRVWVFFCAKQMEFIINFLTTTLPFDVIASIMHAVGVHSEFGRSSKVCLVFGIA